MKILFTIAIILMPILSWGLEQISPATPSITVTGVVQEVIDVENFTYLNLKTKEGDVWAAIINASIKKGSQVTLENVTVMKNFESKALKKTFPTVLFGSIKSADSVKPSSLGIEKYMAIAHPALASPKTIQTQNTPPTGIDDKIPKVIGQNTFTVAEVITKSAALKGKPVLIRGKVVKYNAGIMGKNWIHLRDGSGNETSNSNDILVTTDAQTQLGEVVTVKGIVAIDKDFGAGYSYKVLVEEATLQ
ncbi:MAG: nucleotide-binding protein [Gallionellaceae bacterium]